MIMGMFVPLRQGCVKQMSCFLTSLQCSSIHLYINTGFQVTNNKNVGIKVGKEGPLLESL